jgi:hypothetical protein
MKILLYILILMLTITIIFFLGIKLFNEKIMQSERTGIIRAIVELFFPPNDLYTSLAYADISQNEEIIILQFMNKYSGSHSIDLVLDNLRMLNFTEMYNYSADIKFELEFFLGETVIHSETIENITRNPFSGKEEGYKLYFYKCPRDLPLNKPIKCKVKIINSGDNFFELYGPAKIRARKMSDL